MSDKPELRPIPCPFCSHEFPTVCNDVYTKPRIDRKIEREEERGEQLRQADVDREMGL